MIDADRIRDSHCDLAFIRIFWALLIIIIDLRIGGSYRIDVLPDFLGWIVIFSALGWMEDVHPSVRTIRMLTAAEIFVSLFELVERAQPHRSGLHINIDLSPLALGAFVSLVLMVAIISQLCGLIASIAEALDEPILRARADIRRKLFLALWPAVAVAVLFAATIPPLGIVLVAGVVAWGLVVIVLILALMLHAAGACRRARHRRDVITDIYRPTTE